MSVKLCLALVFMKIRKAGNDKAVNNLDIQAFELFQQGEADEGGRVDPDAEELEYNRNSVLRLFANYDNEELFVRIDKRQRELMRRKRDRDGDTFDQARKEVSHMTMDVERPLWAAFGFHPTEVGKGMTVVQAKRMGFQALGEGKGPVGVVSAVDDDDDDDEEEEEEHAKKPSKK